jgi:glycosyltransferase involved in cell wall biosynthesis
MREPAASGASQPLVSIVVPVFNGARYLRQSLESILAQTYPHFEVIVMDDASTDDTPQILASFGDRIRHVRQPSNRGQFDNVSDGIERARGEFIAVYHSDDIYLPTIVEREAAFLVAHPQAGAVFALDYMIGPEGEPRGRGRFELPSEIGEGGVLDYRTVFNVLLRHKNRLFRTPSSMVRASTYEQVGPYRSRDYAAHADFEMFLRIARAGPVGVLPEHLFMYRWGHGNIDQTGRLVQQDPHPFFSIMNEHLAAGAAELATTDALRAYAAHTAEDQLMRAVNQYILGKLPAGRTLLNQIRITRLVGSPRVQRLRLAALFALLHLAMRLPRSPVLASAFYRRWHAKHGAGALSWREDPLTRLPNVGCA